MGLAFACPFGYLWMFLGRRDGLLCSLSRGLIFLPFHVLLACGLVLLVCRYIWFALLHLVSFRLLVFGYSPLLYLLFWSLRNSPLLDLLLPLDLFFPQEVGSFAVVLSFYPPYRLWFLGFSSCHSGLSVIAFGIIEFWILLLYSLRDTVLMIKKSEPKYHGFTAQHRRITRGLGALLCMGLYRSF